jgi:hypothetical protein
MGKLIYYMLLLITGLFLFFILIIRITNLSDSHDFSKACHETCFPFESITRSMPDGPTEPETRHCFCASEDGWIQKDVSND